MRYRIVLIALSILSMFFILSIFFYYKNRTRNAVESFAENGKMISILIAGSNVYDNNKHIFYAIFSFNPENNKIGITFIPPEFRVDLDGKGKSYKKICEVDINDFKGLSASLERDLKFSLPFYVVLYSPDVERIVDMLEGIDLYVLDKINIQGINFGLNYFDGDKINQYINTVEGNSIYKKYDRIQDILLTLYLSKEKYEKYISIEFIAEIIKKIKTNLLPQEIATLAKFLYKSESDLTCTMVPGIISADGFYTVDEMAYKIYKDDFLRRLVAGTEAERQIKVKILNGTEIAGLARKVRHKFVNEGFNVVEFGTAPYPLFENTVIINRKGETAPVRKVSELLGTDRIYHAVDNTQLTNVLIIIGMDLTR